MNTYLIIGLVVLVILFFFFMRGKTKVKVSKKVLKGKPTPKMPKGGIPPDQFREPTEEEILKMEAQLQKIISYPLEDEEKIAAQLPNMTIEQMAKYADKVTLKHINDEQFLKTQVPDDLLTRLQTAPFHDEEAKFMLLNPTVLGNSAYIALNAKEPYASRAKTALEFLKTKL